MKNESESSETESSKNESESSNNQTESSKNESGSSNNQTESSKNDESGSSKNKSESSKNDSESLKRTQAFVFRTKKLLISVSRFLDTKSLNDFGCTCKNAEDVTRSDDIWKGRGRHSNQFQKIVGETWRDTAVRYLWHHDMMVQLHALSDEMYERREATGGRIMCGMRFHPPSIPIVPYTDVPKLSKDWARIVSGGSNGKSVGGFHQHPKSSIGLTRKVRWT